MKFENTPTKQENQRFKLYLSLFLMSPALFGLIIYLFEHYDFWLILASVFIVFLALMFFIGLCLFISWMIPNDNPYFDLYP